MWIPWLDSFYSNCSGSDWEDAVKAVVDVFAGQPYLTPSYMMDKGYQGKMISGENFSQQSMTDEEDFTGWSNHKIVPELMVVMIQ